jgi:hypothetical protein
MTKNAATKAKKNARAAKFQYDMEVKKTRAAYAKRDAQEAANMMKAEIGWTYANERFGVQQFPDLDSIIQPDDNVDNSFVFDEPPIFHEEHHHDYAAFPPGLSKEDFLALLNNHHGTKRPASDGHEFRPRQSTEQPSQRSASSSGGLADQQVRATDADSPEPNNLAAATYPALGQELSSTTGSATTPGLLSGGHKSPAAEVKAGYDFYLEEDQYLRKHGFKPVAEMRNSMVQAMYGKCSRSDHLLKTLQSRQGQIDIAAHTAVAQHGIEQGAYNCKPLKPSSNRSNQPSWRVNADKCCPDCGVLLVDDIIAARIIAISHLRPEELWKAVICRLNGRWGDYIYHASGICNIYQRDRHCLRKDHVFFETVDQNNRRQGHHSGRYGCWDPIPCIGDHVQVKTLTTRERQIGQAVGDVPLY